MKKMLSLVVAFGIIFTIIPSCQYNLPRTELESESSKENVSIDKTIISSENKEKLYNAIICAQNSDGGFEILPPATSRNADLYTTFYAVSSLSELSALSGLPDVGKTVDWLNTSLRNILANDSASFLDLYYNVMSLKILKNKILDEDDIINRISSLKKQAGFYSDSNSISESVDENILNTYVALKLLIDLNQPIDQSTINWLQLMWEERSNLSIEIKARIFDCLNICGESPEITKNDSISAKESLKEAKTISEINAALKFLSNANSNEIVNILAKLQQTNGGFSFFIPAKSDDPQGTYLAISIYNQFGQEIPNRDKIAAKIFCSQSESGGFFNAGHPGSLAITTYYSLYIIDKLGFKMPAGVAEYIYSSISNESRPNYIYPLILCAKIINIDLTLDSSALSTIYDSIKNPQLGSADDIRNLYYSLYILKYFNSKIDDNIIQEITDEISNLDDLENLKSDLDILSLNYIAKICNILNIEMPNSNKLINCLKQSQTSNGSFSINGDSDIVINYLAIDTLKELDQKVNENQDLINWILQCQSDYCGFQMEPGDNMQFDTDPLLSTFSAISIFNDIVEPS